MRAGDLAPDDADLAAADLLVAAVDESNTLAEVEAAKKKHTTLVYRLGGFFVSLPGEFDVLGTLDVVNALNLDQASARVSDVTRALVAQVTSPKFKLVSIPVS